MAAGQSKDSRNGWLTAIAMLLLCAGGGFLAAPQSQLPLPAAKLQIAISGRLQCNVMYNAPMTVRLASGKLIDCIDTDVLVNRPAGLS